MWCLDAPACGIASQCLGGNTTTADATLLGYHHGAESGATVGGTVVTLDVTIALDFPHDYQCVFGAAGNVPATRVNETVLQCTPDGTAWAPQEDCAEGTACVSCCGLNP